MSIGIAVALRNVGPSMEAAVRSIAAFGDDIEVAVSDASGDPSVRSIFAPIADRIVKYAFEPDGGQSHGLHKAMMALDSPILGWLNHDDFLVRGGAVEVEAAMQGADVAYGESLFFDERGDVVGYHPNVHADPAQLAVENTISQPSCFYSRDLYRQVGGVDFDLHYTMDWDLWRRMAKAGGKLVHVDALWSGVTLSPDAKTAHLSLARAREIAGLIRQGGGRADLPGLLIESMKTAVLWRLRGRKVSPHPYFAVWADKGGAERAPSVADDRHACIFGLQDLSDAPVVIEDRKGGRGVIAAPPGRPKAFERTRLALPYGLANLSAIRLGGAGELN